MASRCLYLDLVNMSELDKSHRNSDNMNMNSGLNRKNGVCPIILGSRKRMESAQLFWYFFIGAVISLTDWISFPTSDQRSYHCATVAPQLQEEPRQQRAANPWPLRTLSLHGG